MANKRKEKSPDGQLLELAAKLLVHIPKAPAEVRQAWIDERSGAWDKLLSPLKEMPMAEKRSLSAKTKTSSRQKKNSSTTEDQSFQEACKWAREAKSKINGRDLPPGFDPDDDHEYKIRLKD